MSEPEGITTYVVTDIEADGPSPLANSMLSFASVACDVSGKVLDEFEAVLAPRPDRQPSPDTMAWWETQPEAYAAATANPEPAATVMPRYADWVESLPGYHVFASAPLIFDGLWMDHYLEIFAGTRVMGGPFRTRKIFRGGGVCIYTMAGALRGVDYLKWSMARVPAEWYGHIEHTHKAIDDARGFVNVLARLFAISQGLEKHEATESMYK